jgi:hypothetical protein
MSNTLLSNLSVKQLKRAVILRGRIDVLQAELAGILGDPGPGSGNGHTGRRTMSASARAKIAAAQRRRWAKQRKAGKGRHTMSAAGRAAISRALKARWAKAKAANRKTLAR